MSGIQILKRFGVKITVFKGLKLLLLKISHTFSNFCEQINVGANKRISSAYIKWLMQEYYQYDSPFCIGNKALDKSSICTFFGLRTEPCLTPQKSI